MVRENPPPVDKAIGKEPNPPDKMQMIEKEMAKL
jgi:hypothetical protein